VGVMPFENIIQKFCRGRALSGRIFNFGKVQGTTIYFSLQASSSLIQSAVCEPCLFFAGCHPTKLGE
jgi:hypothetical protein